jgi:alpha-ketoglutarate-dependent 2,4-dichlorophenoxyacetate dioxygenase
MLHSSRPWDYKKERSMIWTGVSATDANGLAEVRPQGCIEQFAV